MANRARPIDCETNHPAIHPAIHADLLRNQIQDIATIFMNAGRNCHLQAVDAVD